MRQIKRNSSGVSKRDDRKGNSTRKLEWMTGKLLDMN